MGPAADRFGRRRMFLVNLGLYSLFSLLTAFAPDLAWFVAPRFLCGLALGAELTLVDTYVSEFMPRRVRGRCLAWTYTVGFCGAACPSRRAGWPRAAASPRPNASSPASRTPSAPSGAPCRRSPPPPPHHHAVDLPGAPDRRVLRLRLARPRRAAPQGLRRRPVARLRRRDLRRVPAGLGAVDPGHRARRTPHPARRLVSSRRRRWRRSAWSSGPSGTPPRSWRPGSR
ncbi:MFS transporter [Actinomadura kijaniata]|uniref:MFS transporter n=1 Tax=Actinomadura kijaniata TaxID=46161 RepID=UPI0035E437A3